MVALSAAVETNPILDAAIDYANRGLPVFPCDPSTKQPYTSKGFKDASTDVNQICAWWTRYPSAMIGLPTGAVSGFWALDIDVKADANGEIALAKLESANGDLPATPIASTPSGGRHYYFKHQAGVNRGGLEPGIEFAATADMLLRRVLSKTMALITNGNTNPKNLPKRQRGFWSLS
jgi:hypothetical protein